MAQFVYEFLYRGRAKGDPQPAAWQVQLRDDANPQHEGPTLNMTQAIEQGWDQKAIVADINARAVSDRVVSQAAQRDLREQMTALSDQHSAVVAALADHKQRLADVSKRADEAEAQAASVINRSSGLSAALDQASKRADAAEAKVAAMAQAAQDAALAAQAKPSILSKLTGGLLG